MAFDFLGTLSRPKLQELRNFLEDQIKDINEEINYLYTEMNNLTITLINFLEVDAEVNGSMFDRVQEIQTELPNLIVIPKQDDSVSAGIISDIKQPFISTIKYKKERNEYKVKKLIDAIEQDKEMIDRKAIAKSQTTALFDQVEKMFNSDNSSFLFNSEEDRINFSQGIFPA
jgi:hypothetical protein